MSDKPELLPCPFCGEMPKIDPIDDGFHMIICESETCGMQPGVAGKTDTVIAAWNTRADRWIPVSERLPEYNRQVIVYSPKMGVAAICKLEEFDSLAIGLAWTGINMGLAFHAVTHWMPMPALPEEVEK